RCAVVAPPRRPASATVIAPLFFVTRLSPCWLPGTPMLPRSAGRTASPMPSLGRSDDGRQRRRLPGRPRTGRSLPKLHQDRTEIGAAERRLHDRREVELAPGDV